MIHIMSLGSFRPFTIPDRQQVLDASSQGGMAALIFYLISPLLTYSHPFSHNVWLIFAACSLISAQYVGISHGML